MTRYEMFVAAAAGEDIDLPMPVTRREFFLAAAAGETVSVPSPITREEMYLNELVYSDKKTEQEYAELLVEEWGYEDV